MINDPSEAKTKVTKDVHGMGVLMYVSGMSPKDFIESPVYDYAMKKLGYVLSGDKAKKAYTKPYKGIILSVDPHHVTEVFSAIVNGTTKRSKEEEYNARLFFADAVDYANSVDAKIPPRTEDTSPIGFITAADIIESCQKIMGDRASEYDQPSGERSMQATVDAFNSITGNALTASDGYLLMLLLKAVRGQTAADPKSVMDSIKDGVAYSALYGECMAVERGITK